MKLNKLHLFGIVLLVLLVGALLYGTGVIPSSLGNKEGVQSLNEGGSEFLCKAVPKKPPQARDVELGYYAQSNNMATPSQNNVHAGLLPAENKEGFFSGYSRLFGGNIVEGTGGAGSGVTDPSGNDASGNATASTSGPSNNGTQSNTGGASNAASAEEAAAATELAACHATWKAESIKNYNEASDDVKKAMEASDNWPGCKPPTASQSDATTTIQATDTDSPQYKCVQVGQEFGGVNEERYDEKGVEGKMRGVPKGDEHLYMLKTKIVPPVCPKCPECPCAKCPVCEKPNPNADTPVEDEKGNNDISKQAQETEAQQSQQRNPEKSQESQARENRVNKQMNNLGFLQPRQGASSTLQQGARRAAGMGNVSGNSYYNSKAKMALPKINFGANDGTYSGGLLGPLPRLASFSAFGN